MKKDRNYNWWTDPENAEKVKKISWWEHEENKTTITIPVSIIQDESGHWCVGTNKMTEELLGKPLSSFSAQGETRQEAIESYFKLMKVCGGYLEERVNDYQRWVPFRKGAWNHTGGKWFVVFGLHFYFRYGNGMKFGRYIPFTKLNISFHNEWALYRKYKAEKK